MSTLTVDSAFPRHVKVAPLSDAAFRLHFAALAYCAEHETDGFMPESEVSTLTKHPDKTPLIQELERAKGPRESGHPLWRRSARTEVTGWDLHDYLDWNDSHAELEAKRERERIRSRTPRRAAAGPKDRPPSQRMLDGIHADPARISERIPSAQAPSRVPSHLVDVSNGKQSPDPDPSGDPDRNSTRARGGRGSTIPDGWEPTEKDIAFAAAKGWDAKRVADEAEHFRARHMSRGTVSKSWAASWITWVIQGIRFDRLDGRQSGVQRSARPGPSRAVQPDADNAEGPAKVYR